MCLPLNFTRLTAQLRTDNVKTVRPLTSILNNIINAKNKSLVPFIATERLEIGQTSAQTLVK